MNELILQLFLLQVGLPLVLIALNAILPSMSRGGLAVRSLAVLLLLGYACLAGVWLFPPWWTPYLLALAHMAATLWAFRRLSRSRKTRQPWLRRAETGVGVLVAFAAVLLLVPTLEGRRPPSVAIDLASPLAPGRYLVTSGGSTAAINAHFATLERERAAPFRGQSFAVDLIAIDRMGLRAGGIVPVNPRAYRIYGRDILAPCPGRVSGAVDGVADNLVPQRNRDSMAGNHVLLACGDVLVLLAHMIPGTVAVRTGDVVSTGQLLGQVGNSGNSAEPHLHIHVQMGTSDDAPLSGEPAWFTVDGDFLVRNEVVEIGD